MTYTVVSRSHRGPYSQTTTMSGGYNDQTTMSGSTQTAYFVVDSITAISPPVEVFPVITQKFLRDLAAAKAHADFVYRAVRAPPSPEPPQYVARHGFQDAPRRPCYRARRVR